MTGYCKPGPRPAPAPIRDPPDPRRWSGSGPVGKHGSIWSRSADTRDARGLRRDLLGFRRKYPWRNRHAVAPGTRPLATLADSVPGPFALEPGATTRAPAAFWWRWGSFAILVGRRLFVHYFLKRDRWVAAWNARSGSVARCQGTGPSRLRYHRSHSHPSPEKLKWAFTGTCTVTQLTPLIWNPRTHRQPKRLEAARKLAVSGTLTADLVKVGIALPTRPILSCVGVVGHGRGRSRGLRLSKT